MPGPSDPYNMTGLILAGGKSRRMGRSKAELDVGGRSLIGRVVDLLTPLCREVIIVGRNPLDFLEYGVKAVRDLVPGQGPLGGLATGLFYSRSPWCLATACDLPFLSPEILNFMAEKTAGLPQGPQALVPRTQGGWQPLAALYSRACLAPALKLLAEGQRKVDDLKDSPVVWRPVSMSELRYFDPQLKSFTNVNTPEELDLARRRIAEES